MCDDADGEKAFEGGEVRAWGEIGNERGDERRGFGGEEVGVQGDEEGGPAGIGKDLDGAAGAFASCAAGGGLGEVGFLGVADLCGFFGELCQLSMHSSLFEVW